jgi:hypothetical protein
MRWPWSRKRPAPQVSGDVADAVAARRRAENALARERRRTSEVRDVAATSRQHGAVNHFAQLITETFKGTS